MIKFVKSPEAEGRVPFTLGARLPSDRCRRNHRECRISRYQLMMFRCLVVSDLQHCILRLTHKTTTSNLVCAQISQLHFEFQTSSNSNLDHPNPADPPTTAKSKRRLRFMDLPGEVRNQIYTLFIADDSLHFVGKELGILQANRQIREESLHLFYERNWTLTFFPRTWEKYASFANSKAATYLRRITMVCPYPQACIRVNVRLHEDHIAFDFCAGLPKNVFVALTRHITSLIDIEVWAMETFRSKEKPTGRDLLIVVHEIGRYIEERRGMLASQSGHFRLHSARLGHNGWEFTGSS